MKIAVLGTGAVGRAHAAALTALGHQVALGTRSPQATRSRTAPDLMGAEPYATWAEQHPDISLANYAQAAQGADLLVNATAGHVSLAALTAAGADSLAGKVLIDTATPNNFTATAAVPLAAPWGGSAPLLEPVGNDSLAEQIQRAFPEAKVVKAVNTVAAHLMTDPAALTAGEHTLFLAGNDQDAKRQVTNLLTAYGWRDIIDLGDLPAARIAFCLPQKFWSSMLAAPQLRRRGRALRPALL
jgi:predicted dinucleotide-binding enzyme